MGSSHLHKVSLYILAINEFDDHKGSFEIFDSTELKLQKSKRVSFKREFNFRESNSTHSLGCSLNAKDAMHALILFLVCLFRRP